MVHSHHPPSCIFSLAVGTLPGPASLHDVPEISNQLQLPHQPPLPPPGDDLSAVISVGLPDTSRREPSITIWACLTPVPGWLVKKIESGQFIEMGEFLPECLGLLGSSTEEESHRLPKPKYRPVTTIIEWVQCFCVFVAVLSRSQPHRVPDLMGYQALILQAHLEFQGDSWLGYDRNFRLRAASEGNQKWSTIDTTLWNLAFSGNRRFNRCKFCFSSSHSAAECGLSQNSQSSRPTVRSFQPIRQYLSVCYHWNNNPMTLCPFPACKYKHKCALCIRGPHATDADHK